MARKDAGAVCGGFEMELVGLEPTTSWVKGGASRTRTDDLLGAIRECDRVWEPGFSALESGTRLAGSCPRRSADSRGLPGITFDLGTRKGLVPIHLGRTLNFRVPVMRLGLCFSRLAGSEGVTAAFHRGVAARGTHARSEFVREQRVQGALSLSLCAESDSQHRRRWRYCFHAKAAASG